METPSIPVGVTRVTASNGYQPPLPASVPPPKPPPSVSSPIAALSVIQPQSHALETTTVAPVLLKKTKEPGLVPVIATSPPSIEFLPTYIPVVPSAVWYNEQTQHISVPPVRGVPSHAVTSLRERSCKEHRTGLCIQPVNNKYLWRPAPTKETIASEPWRGVYWKHVDVHRYIARRYCSSPPPIE
ncbi:hypothetical protein TraAM80_05898 [Trypanosoma rangeli]|uniref:Uncharacterized protein n=1 Tax=Trypanosoma rangeli TaxID=5698 RepID=A0A422NCK9_TRYRA|nr:uncharacterized protein TraAM80_05898 [Trypanosoma rangeli]RNF03218.1 hypothetical protein TraAM80_05898 [Trypanosoma rangeli]|eukprot:RNF03218.1 hypothetical protein TraAM80_05898 [Trypanosoma rangeli]